MLKLHKQRRGYSLNRGLQDTQQRVRAQSEMAAQTMILPPHHSQQTTPGTMMGTEQLHSSIPTREEVLSAQVQSLQV